MIEKIKEILYSALIILIVLLVGFSPVVRENHALLDWGDLGWKMVEAGVIDKDKFESLYRERGGFSEADKRLLYGTNNKNLIITKENSGMMLNILWAFGLANKNLILTEGPMMTYGGAGLPAEALAKAGNFASTGGWTLAKGDAMEHYGAHSFVELTYEQQALVEKVAKNIYRPCCDNPTHFPDCNHGMAMLGLLELMAAQGASEREMYRAALEANTYWFPSQYETIKSFFAQKGVNWEKADPKEVISAEYSSASGFRKVMSQVEPQEKKSGTGCGI